MANTFTSAATGSNTSINTLYTCPSATTAVVHAVYVSNTDGTNDANVSISVSGSLNVEKGRVFEQGTSVIDHATAMAIVFGG